MQLISSHCSYGSDNSRKEKKGIQMDAFDYMQVKKELNVEKYFSLIEISDKF